MYLPFNIRKNAVLTALLAIFTIPLWAQNYPIQITVVVTPPYSTKISDYTSQPGKIMANIRNTAAFGRAAQVYLTGEISSESGVSVRTASGYKPAQPILLAPGASLIVNINNIQEVFSGANVEYEGITASEIIQGNGLPEDIYTICLRAWDFKTDEPLSGENPIGCCAPFNVSNLEVPMITQPLCDENITATTPQNIIFSWTRPAGAPLNTRYKLLMVEVQPSDHNPEDAINTARFPFYQTTLTTSTFIYGPAQPSLVEGKTYAFRITAEDPMGKVVFRNGGHSEVCSFSWNKNLIKNDFEITFDPPTPDPDTINIGGLKFNPPPPLLPTTVQGRLQYEYMEDAGKKYDLAGANIKLVLGHVSIQRGTSLADQNAIIYAVPPMPTLVNGDKNYGKLLATGKTDVQGNFTFTFFDNTEYKELVSAGAEVGNAVYNTALIVIEDPHAQFYYNPKKIIIPLKGLLNNLGTITTYVRSCELEVTANASVQVVGGNMYDHQGALINEKVDAAEVYLCRKTDFSYQIFPLEDGGILSGHQNLDAETRGRFAGKGLTVLAKGTTGKNGVVTFKRMVWHHNSTYAYYIMAETDKTGMTNFTMDGPSIVVQPTEVTSNNIKKRPGTDPYFTAPQEKQRKTIYMKPEYPSVKGKVTDIETTPLKNATVLLDETYSRESGNLTILYPHYLDHLFQDLYNWLNFHTEYSLNRNYNTLTNSAGGFEFKDLAILYNRQNKQVTGPMRKLTAKAEGYTTRTFEINPLRFGEQSVKSIQLEMGAIIKGRVTDPEYGGSVAAYVSVDGGDAQLVDKFGNYEIPCKFLPNKIQRLKVSCEGYLDEEIAFFTPKKINHLDIKIYKKERRLKVTVVDKVTKQPIPNIWVVIQGVGPVQNGIPSDKSDFTDTDGIVTLNFKNAGESNPAYRVKVVNLHRYDVNYKAENYTLQIPVSKKATEIYCQMAPAACMRGMVTAGTEASPVAGASVRLFLQGDTLSAVSNYAGQYYMRNIPVHRFPRAFTALKSQSNFVGDEKLLVIAKASNECVNTDFNLTVYNDMDITNLMGFPMEVSKLTEEKDGKVTINGNIVGIPGNDQFSTDPGTLIPFANVIIKKSTGVNANNVPLSEPAILPVKLSKSKLSNVVVLQTFRSDLQNSGKLLLDRYVQNSPKGAIKGQVKIPSTEFNTNLFTLPDLYLATTADNSATKMNLTAFVGDPAIKKPVSVGNNGFYACNASGKPIVYSLPQFNNAATAKADSSFVQQGKIVLSTTLTTNLNNIKPANINLKLGALSFTKDAVTLPPAKKIGFSMDKWKVVSTSWKFTTQGLELSQSTVQAQMSMPVTGMLMQYNSLYTAQAVPDFSNAPVLGNVTANVTGNLKGLSYIEKNPGEFRWNIFASSSTFIQPAASIPNLTGLYGDQSIPLRSIQLYSDNSPLVMITAGANLRLFGILDAETGESNYLSINADADVPYFYIPCTYKPGIPYMHTFTGALSWMVRPGSLDFDIFLPDVPNFTHNQMQFQWNDNTAEVSENLFTVKGITFEEGKIGPIDIVLNHKKQSTEIDIPADETIPIAQNGKYFKNVIGGMEASLQTDSWNVFWFEGEMTGMNAISNNGQPNRLLFRCNGEIQASGQSVSVSQLDAFPGMTLRYDMANARLEGKLAIDKDLMGMSAKGTADCIFDQYGWYFNVNGEISIPGIGGCGLYGLFGDYTTVPPSISAPYGSMTCIPPEFQGSVSGFLLQGSITKQLIPPVECGFTLPVIDQFVGVNVSADLSLTARTWMTFGSNVNSYGIATMAEGKVSGGLATGVFNINVNTNAQLGVSGTYYSNGNFSLIGCGSVQAGVSGSVCCDPTSLEWVDFNLASPALGIKMNISNSGVDCDLLLESCSSNICPTPSL